MNATLNALHLSIAHFEEQLSGWYEAERFNLLKAASFLAPYDRDNEWHDPSAPVADVNTVSGDAVETLGIVDPTREVAVRKVRDDLTADEWDDRNTTLENLRAIKESLVRTGVALAELRRAAYLLDGAA